MPKMSLEKKVGVKQYEKDVTQYVHISQVKLLVTNFLKWVVAWFL
jgi:hypothetical protein